MDLCIRHKEWQEFTDPSGKLQQKFGNLYYHANIPCVQVCWPNFESSWLCVDATVIAQLTQIHLEQTLTWYAVLIVTHLAGVILIKECSYFATCITSYSK